MYTRYLDFLSCAGMMLWELRLEALRTQQRLRAHAHSNNKNNV